MDDWNQLPEDLRKEAQDLARQTLSDITLNRLAALFSETEFAFLERGANGEPIDLGQLLAVTDKLNVAQAAQNAALKAFRDQVRALGCPPDMPISEFCASRGFPVPTVPGLPDIITIPARKDR
jgi:hypothetical protein